MFSSKSKTLLVVVILVGCGSAFADYYESDLFPIGLTGLNYTGWDTTGSNCPYGTQGWRWDQGTNNEQSLIFSLGVNCIGCEDAKPDYLVDLYPDTLTSGRPWTSNYLHKVCIPSFMDDGDSTNPERIYIIEFVNITDSLPDSLDLED